MSQTKKLDLDKTNESTFGGPVECMGKAFANESERRKYYLRLLARKLEDPDFRKTEGFPLGEDDDILRLSDPPYFTACPNPFLSELANSYRGKSSREELYTREPYAADVSEGKNSPIYMAHSYHTKVPHKAIMRYILHYTEPGDLIFDGFSGTGMTGVAAALCGDKNEVESLGYNVQPDGTIAKEISVSTKSAEKKSFARLGARRAFLSDLSPAATFIAQNYNVPKSPELFDERVMTVIDEIEEKLGWLYETNHEASKKGKINYTVWSDVYVCPECSKEVIFWDAAVDRAQASVETSFPCQACSAILTKRSAKNATETSFDKYRNAPLKKKKRIPVLINYSYGGRRFEKQPDAVDIALLASLSDLPIDEVVPTGKIIDGKEIGRLKSAGIHYVDQLLPERANLVLAEFLRLTRNDRKLQIIVTAALLNLSWMYRWRANGKGGITSGTYYVCATPQENNAFTQMRSKAKAISKAWLNATNVVTTQDSSCLSLPDEVFDYMFFDPPFGANLMYSELSFLWESWLGVRTNDVSEAIENSYQGKGVHEYRALMNACFKEAYRLLKPGRWITVEFSNTKASVWNGIQTALTEAGFIIANVSALDKKQGSFKAVTTATAVKQDLVISAYKPSSEFEKAFTKEFGFDSVWDFLRNHLEFLPVTKMEDGELIKIPERDIRILFDQVVSYFVRHLRDVPISSSAFQQGVLERFSERDGMIFLPKQIAEYEKARISSRELKQLEIFVDDEVSAIEWLRQQLNPKPQTYQQLHPHFISELTGWKKVEEQLELFKLLEQNFLKYDGAGPVPPQLHSYLSTNFRDLRNLQKDSPELVQKAKDRWYVPNPEREEDLQKLREKDLLSQFDKYRAHIGRNLKTVRLEAVRCGFKKAWQDRDYATIVEVAEKIPQNLLEEDQKLLMWYDQAITRAE